MRRARRGLDRRPLPPRVQPKWLRLSALHPTTYSPRPARSCPADVSSPVRAFSAVGPDPFFVDTAKGHCSSMSTGTRTIETWCRAPGHCCFRTRPPRGGRGGLQGSGARGTSLGAPFRARGQRALRPQGRLTCSKDRAGPFRVVGNGERRWHAGALRRRSHGARQGACIPSAAGTGTWTRFWSRRARVWLLFGVPGNPSVTIGTTADAES